MAKLGEGKGAKSPNETKILPKTFETSKGRAGSHKLNESILLYCEISLHITKFC